ncbi:MAG: general secretion pathway protein GspL [Aquabacterium sp.]|jgi:general secretion pathway protein L|nr:MAG: general secretion pathway protein GspL [Aquabacterium sp.]TAL18004.1 MAG: general secretion pathway protein GspL [Aquabacterium sp.]
MSTLILQLPAPARRSAPPPAADETDAAGSPEAVEAALRERIGDEITYVLTSDGVNVQRHGAALPSLLPRADTVIAVLPVTEVSWHRLQMPKASGARLRAALAGILEEALLDDPGLLHLALAPQAKAGEQTWVAATRLAPLSERIAALEKAGLPVDRIVPAIWPDDPPSGYFTQAPDDRDELQPTIQLSWSTRDGVATWPAKGGAARALLPDALPPTARFFATPAVAAPAERWLGAPVTLQTEAEHLLQAARSLWDLRQFDLAPSHRGLAVLTDRWRRFVSPDWRPVRWGLGLLVAVQVVGLNLRAWEVDAALRAKQQAMVTLLRETHKDIPAAGVLDAPAQMRRANETLRAAAGRAGDEDFEPMLQVAASAWPQGQPVQGLQYESGSLTFSVPDWNPGQLEQFRSALEAAGWKVESKDDRITLMRDRRS